LIVGIEPSEVLIWRDEVKSLLNKKSLNILLFEECVLELHRLKILPSFKVLNAKVWIYEHCHQRSLAKNKKTLEALKIIPKVKIEFVDGGCCGMAGDFGYKHPEISKKIAHNSLDIFMGKVEKADKVLVTGISCRRQISDIYKVSPIHLSQLLLELSIK
jgi:Fe-S oxidoreductase